MVAITTESTPDERALPLGVNIHTEIGSSRWGVAPGGYAWREDELPELQGQRGLKIFRSMRFNNPIVAAVVMATKMIIRGVEWSAERADGVDDADAEAEEARLHLEQCMADMDQPWEEFVDDSLEAVIYGFAIPEIVYKQRLGPQPEQTRDVFVLPHSEFDDGRIGWKDIAYRDPVGVMRWDVDEHGRVWGFWHKANQMLAEEVYIPIAKCVHFRASRLGNDPQGLSWLRAAYRPDRHKRNMEWLEGVAAERGFAGLPVIQMPAGSNTNSNSTDYSRAQQLVENVRADAYAGVILPPPLGDKEHQKWHFTLEGAGQMSDQLDTAIRRYAGEIAASVLAYFIILTMNNRGAYALSKDQRDLWHLAMSGLVDTWGQIINKKLVRPLFELNRDVFPDRTKWPKIVPGDVAQHDIDKLQTYLTGLIGAGALEVNDEDRNRLRALIGWPNETKEQVEARAEREAAMAEIQQAAFQTEQEVARSGLQQNDQQTSSNEKEAAPRGQQPPRQASELSIAESIVGKPVNEWLPEDAWVVAMALEDAR